MVVQGSSIGVPCGQTDNCVDEFGCPSGICPDFTIRRHDTRPPFKVAVEDCDGPLDLTDLVLEANMWAKAKLKAAIDEDDTFFQFADGIGFQQVMVGDIIVIDRVRLPEHMLVLGFDETNKYISVQRGYNGTQAQAFKKGQSLRIFRVMNAPAVTEMELDDIEQVDGTTLTDQIIASFLIYEFQANDTCLPGCYLLEFKLLKMAENGSAGMLSTSTTTVIPSFTDPSLTPEDFGCILGEGVEWVRRFPVTKEGFLIKITDSPTTEL
jgi:hypothetical protein